MIKILSSTDFINLTALPTQIAVYILSPVNIHTLIPIDLKEPTVSTTPACNLSSTPVTAINLMFLYMWLLHSWILSYLFLRLEEAAARSFRHSSKVYSDMFF